MSRQTLPGLPLLHDGDSFIIYLTEVGTKCLRIVGIHRYPHNQNSSGVEEDFFSLDEMTRAAVIRQINRRFAGKTVIPR